MTAIFRSDAALQVIAKNATAQAAISNASSTVMAKTVATLADLNPDSYADMNAIAASSAARAAIEKSQTAKDAIAASDVATAKYAVGAAGLNPADYANMSAVASSSAATAAIAAEDDTTALSAVLLLITAAIAAEDAATAAIAAEDAATSLISAYAEQDSPAIVATILPTATPLPDTARLFSGSFIISLQRLSSPSRSSHELNS